MVLLVLAAAAAAAAAKDQLHEALAKGAKDLRARGGGTGSGRVQGEPRQK